MQTLSNWQKKASQGKLAGTNNYDPELVLALEQIKQLKRELKTAQEEKDILNEEGYSEALLRPDARQELCLKWDEDSKGSGYEVAQTGL